MSYTIVMLERQSSALMACLTFGHLVVKVCRDVDGLMSHSVGELGSFGGSKPNMDDCQVMLATLKRIDRSQTHFCCPTIRSDQLLHGQSSQLLTKIFPDHVDIFESSVN